ncbi:MAG: hypothetical protein U0414_11285 [Polyangiaceae bacterium]
MRKRSEAVRSIERSPNPRAEGLLRGKLSSLRPDGQIMVVVDGAVRPAALATAASEAEIIACIRARSEVALGTFEDGTLVIMGILRQRMAPAAPSSGAAVERVIEIAATEVLELRAGEARIRLTGDGRVEIRGLELVSISEGQQRLLGATVSIN